MQYKFKPKDKVCKYYPKKDKYETQHGQTDELKIYTVCAAGREGVVLYNVPYLIFNYAGHIAHYNPTKCFGTKVNATYTAAKPIITWYDAVIIPLSTYKEQLW